MQNESRQYGESKRGRGGGRGRGRGRGGGAPLINPLVAAAVAAANGAPAAAAGAGAGTRDADAKADAAAMGASASASASAGTSAALNGKPDRFGAQGGAQGVQDWNARIGLPGLRFDAFPAPKVLLSDAQVQHFIRFGYVAVQPSGLDAKFHAAVFAHCQQFFAGAVGRGDEHNPGNNILPVMPALQQVFDDPSVSGALQSVLGDGYIMHAHRYAHPSFPGRKEQTWHKDSYFGYRETRSHRPNWVMAMYYPQDTTLPMGPTGIIPGSQYFASTTGDASRHTAKPVTDWPVEEWPAVCRAGTVVIIHYDIWHKGMANDSDRNRYMFKFQFIRTTQPTAPTWQCASTAWDPLAEPALRHGCAAPPLITAADGKLSAEQQAELLAEHKAALGRDGAKAAAKAAVSAVTLPRMEQLRAQRAADKQAKAADAKGGAKAAATAATVGGAVFSDQNECAFLSGRMAQAALEDAKAAVGVQAFANLSKDELKAVKECATAATRLVFRDFIARDKAQALLFGCGDVWVDVWRWMCGLSPIGAAAAADAKAAPATGAGAAVAVVPKLTDLTDERESVRLFAAYRIARVRGLDAVRELIAAVGNSKGADAEGRNAMHALTAVGVGALPAMLQALADAGAANDWLAQSRLCTAIGEVCGYGGGVLVTGKHPQALADAVKALCVVLTRDNARLGHHSEQRDAAQALAKLFASKSGSSAGGVAGVVYDDAVVAMAVQSLLKGTIDGDDQVRYVSCLSVGRIAAVLSATHGGQGFPKVLVRLTVSALARALNDSCRYVVANALEALKAMREIPDATDLALRALTTMRWCPITTMQKAF